MIRFVVDKMPNYPIECPACRFDFEGNTKCELTGYECVLIEPNDKCNVLADLETIRKEEAEKREWDEFVEIIKRQMRIDESLKTTEQLMPFM